jgi:hypothetical protein
VVDRGSIPGRGGEGNNFWHRVCTGSETGPVSSPRGVGGCCPGGKTPGA